MRVDDRQPDERRTMRLFVACYPSRDAVAELDAALGRVRDRWPALRWAPADQWHLTLAFYGEVAIDRVDELTERVGRAAARCPPLRLRLTRLGAFPSARRARVCWVAVEAADAGDSAAASVADGPAVRREVGANPAAAGVAAAPAVRGEVREVRGEVGEVRGEVGGSDRRHGDARSPRGTRGDGPESRRDDVEELRRLAARCVAAGRRIGVGGDDAGKPYRPHLTVARPRRPPLDVAPLAADLADHVGPPWVADEIRLVRSHLGAQVRHETVRVLPLHVGAG